MREAMAGRGRLGTRHLFTLGLALLAIAAILGLTAPSPVSAQEGSETTSTTSASTSSTESTSTTSSSSSTTSSSTSTTAATPPNDLTVKLDVTGDVPAGAQVERAITCSGQAANVATVALADGASATVDVIAGSRCEVDLNDVATTPPGVVFATCETSGDAQCLDDAIQFGSSGTATVTFEVLLGTETTAQVNPNNPKPGDKVQVTATGYDPGEDVIVELYSDPVMLGELTADASGKVTGSFTIPAGTPLGEHDIVVTGFAPDGSLRFAVGPITVTGAAGSTTSTSRPSLPVMGARSTDTAVLAFGFFAAGMIALGVALQRRARFDG